MKYEELLYRGCCLIGPFSGISCWGSEVPPWLPSSTLAMTTWGLLWYFYPGLLCCWSTLQDDRGTTSSAVETAALHEYKDISAAADDDVGDLIEQCHHDF